MVAEGGQEKFRLRHGSGRRTFEEDWLPKDVGTGCGKGAGERQKDGKRFEHISVLHFCEFEHISVQK